ncbi:3-dehydroquinate synthase [Hymenobacter aquaticus]|uniref:3-dehydroquinate synthase n=1 Tax=Hymenobacter aquaticus TaxID=1867101 RepID=A0A4Z0PX04_9BACT|nr:3-dehydroquinate synthase [Hymenobacter aquaticus]TGE22310.1 3-dehydroquinate synthase [Hymenobacter aquaticus]
MLSSVIQQQFQVSFSYPVYFTEELFRPDNSVLRTVLTQADALGPRRAVVVLDSGVVAHHPHIQTNIAQYFTAHAEALQLNGEPLVVAGGEACKNSPALVQQLLEVIHQRHVDRHSYLLAVGGGAVLDLVGYVAAVAHRGVRLVRIPTTVLSQNDSGIGVKNSVNAFGKKNFLGTFAPPYAVLNDSRFLLTLDERDWRAGIAEAIKVGLIKDAAFFTYLEQHTPALVARHLPTMQHVIRRCAELHLQHIAGPDPFEQGSSRPLDFGHWAAHKLEQLTDYQLRHGEAVAIGIALDCVYSHLAGLIEVPVLERVLRVLHELGFAVFCPKMAAHAEQPAHPDSLLLGLQEFREHLGGQLTVMLLAEIGRGVEVHALDTARLLEAISYLKAWQNTSRSPVEPNLHPLSLA